MKLTKHQSGFILVEFIITLVLIGIIGVFTGLFIYTAVSGYLNSKDAAEGAMKAQVALDRIRMELRGVSRIIAIDDTAPDLSIQYEHEDPSLTGPRTLSYNTSQKNLFIQTPPPSGGQFLLMNDASNFTLTVGTDNLDGEVGPTKEEVSSIEIVFTMKNIGKPFKVDIYPRNMVKEP